jgi:hypothetical protein
LLLLLSLWACREEPVDPGLTVEQIVPLLPSDVGHREEWAAAVRSALVEADQIPNADHVCQVLAIIEQESTYNPDPPVPGLAKVVRAEVDEKFAKLGLLAKPTRDLVLSPVPEGSSKSFDQQLSSVKTEQDVDELFRAILAHHEKRAPQVADVLHSLFPRKFDSLNPVATAGSMQVSVAWAQELGRQEGLAYEDVRDLLYTRTGGVKYGTARLFAHDVDHEAKREGAPYDQPIHRFADYNAGLYASRNAAFQEVLSKLTEQKLAPDGDLLQWTESGRPKGEQNGETVRALEAFRVRYAPDLTSARILKDLQYEKSAYFEETDTWSRVRETYKAHFGKQPPYARVPDVALDSPKLRKDLTTSWFATNVERRYKKCVSRHKG